MAKQQMEYEMKKAKMTKTKKKRRFWSRGKKDNVESPKIKLVQTQQIESEKSSGFKALPIPMDDDINQKLTDAQILIGSPMQDKKTLESKYKN